MADFINLAPFPDVNGLGDNDNEEEQPQEPPYSPLHAAASQGNLGAVKALFQDGGHNINEPDDNDRTPLYLALQNQHSKVAKYLLKNGAVSEGCCDEDSDLLHLTVAKGNLEVARMLVELGANVDGSYGMGIRRCTTQRGQG